VSVQVKWKGVWKIGVVSLYLENGVRCGHSYNGLRCSHYNLYCCTANVQNNASTGNDEEDASGGVSQSQYLALMVIMPFFLCCYGGSCVAYIVYKIYRSCSRDQLHAKFVHEHAAEFSSQMPPSYPVIHNGCLTKKQPYQPSIYLHEPMFGAAAAAVSLLCLCLHHKPLHCLSDCPMLCVDLYVCVCPSHFLSTRLQVRPLNGFLQLIA